MLPKPAASSQRSVAAGFSDAELFAAACCISPRYPRFAARTWLSSGYKTRVNRCLCCELPEGGLCADKQSFQRPAQYHVATSYNCFFTVEGNSFPLTVVGETVVAI